MEPARLEGLVGRACNTCRQVIRSQSESFECTYCRIPICWNCLSGHDSTHKTAIVHVTMITSSGISNTDEICVRCSKISHYRYSCLKCVHAYCRGCWSDKGVNTHQHRDFEVVEPNVRQQTQGDESLCCWDANFGHCDFCKAPNKFDQPTRVCKTCHENYNELIFHCKKCQVNEGPLHDWSHELWQWRFLATEPGQNYIHCNTCNMTFHHMRQLRQHSHMSYTLYQDQMRLEDAIFRSYRRCWNKQSRRDALVSEGGDQQCSCCRHKFPHTRLNYCRACNLQTKFCSHCTVSATPTSLHCHPVSSFVTFSDLPSLSVQASSALEVSVQQLSLNQNIPVVEQTPMSGQDSPVYASQSSSLPVQRQQSTEAPNNSKFPALIPVRFPVNVVRPSQLPEQVHRASPVPPQISQPVETRQVSIPLEKARRDASHSNFFHYPQSSEPGASQGGSLGPRSNEQAPSLTQFSKSKESLLQESNAVSLYSASSSSLPQFPQSFDRARLGGGATSLSPASPSNFPRLSQPLDQDDCRDKASPLSPVPASNFPRDRDSEGIRIAHHHPSPSLPVTPTTRPLPTPTASDSTQTAYGFTLSPAQTVPPAKSQTRPEPLIHSFSAPLPPDHVIPADQEQRATKVRESNLTGAKMKATAAKFAKNKYVRAGAKIGARVAISQVSTNLIGMDVSGVVDGVGQVANVANAISGAMSSSGVDLSDVAGGSGGDSGDGNGVVGQVIGAMQNPSVQIQVGMDGDWSSSQNRANRPNMFSASRFMNRKHSGS